MPGGAVFGTRILQKGAAMAAVDKLASYMELVKQDLLDSLNDTVVRNELEGVLRKLHHKAVQREYLAIRGYLMFQKSPPPHRSGTIEQNWVWSKKQSEDYQKTQEYADALAEIAKVNREFQALNKSDEFKDLRKGKNYELAYVTDVRTLATQTNNWLGDYDPKESEGKRKQKEGARKIQAGSHDLMNKLLKEIAKADYPDPPDKAGVEKLKKFLTSETAKPSPAPSFATPGLSAHGQVRAFDFKIMLAGREVAGTSTTKESIANWANHKWEKQLNRAVRRVDPDEKMFEGPLEGEPWHYFYTPRRPAPPDHG
jgi:hypothetical protein